MSLPASIFKFVTIRSYNYTLDVQEMKATEISYKFAPQVQKSSVTGLEGLYLIMMHERGNQRIDDPWVPVIRSRYENYAAGNEGVNLFVSSMPRPVSLTCTDLLVSGRPWVDQQNNGCGNYKEKAWCNKEGWATNQFLRDHPNVPWNTGTALYDESVKADGWGAPEPCCACGGGSFGGSRYMLPSYMDKDRLNVQDM